MCLFLSKIDYNQQRINPRLRGEKDHLDAAEYIAAGTPPPTRGKVCIWAYSLIAPRITPAYAGKSLSRTPTA